MTAIRIFSLQYWDNETKREQTASPTTGWPTEVGGGITNYDVKENYSANDIVVKDNQFYQANSAIGSGSVFTIGNTGPTWTLLSASAVTTIAGWVDTKTYSAGDLAIHDDILYQCKHNAIKGAWNDADWKAISSTIVSTEVPDFSESSAYKRGEMVFRSGRMYYAKNGITPDQWDASEWEEINTSRPTTVTSFSASRTYVADELVEKDGSLYMARIALTAGAWNVSQWRRMSIPTLALGDFDVSRDYLGGTLTIYNDNLYRAKADVTAGAWNAAQWTQIGKQPVKANISFAPDFDPAKTYTDDALVVYSNDLYRAKADVAPAVWDKTKWDRLTSTSTLALSDFSNILPYLRNELVFRNGNIYRAKADVPAGTWAIAQWEKVSCNDCAIGNFDAAATYEANTVVIHDSRLYVSKAAIAPNQFMSHQWTLLGNMEGELHDFSTSKIYHKDDVVYHDQQLYRAKAYVGAGGFAEAQWDNLTPKIDAVASVKLFSANSAYAVNELVIHNRCLYRAKTALAKHAWEELKWEKVSYHVAKCNPHNATTYYGTGDLVIYNNKVYRCKVSYVSPGGFSDGQWELLIPDVPAFKNLAPDFSTTKSYTTDEIAVYQGELYRAKSYASAGGFSAGQWVKISWKPVDTVGLGTKVTEVETKVDTAVARQMSFTTLDAARFNVTDTNHDFKTGDIAKNGDTYLRSLKDQKGTYLITAADWQNLGDTDTALKLLMGEIRTAALAAPSADTAGAAGDGVSGISNAKVYTGTSTTYKRGEVMNSNGTFSRCTVDNLTITSSTRGSDWENFGKKPAALKAAGEDTNKLIVALMESNSLLSERVAYLDRYSKALAWTAYGSYTYGDIVLHSGKYYRCVNTKVTALSTPTVPDWKELPALPEVAAASTPKWDRTLNVPTTTTFTAAQLFDPSVGSAQFKIAGMSTSMGGSPMGAITVASGEVTIDTTATQAFVNMSANVNKSLIIDLPTSNGNFRLEFRRATMQWTVTAPNAGSSYLFVSRIPA